MDIDSYKTFSYRFLLWHGLLHYIIIYFHKIAFIHNVIEVFSMSVLCHAYIHV